MPIVNLVGFQRQVLLDQTTVGWSPTFSSDSSLLQNYNFRVLVPRAYITYPPPGAMNVRVSLRFIAHSSNTSQISSCYIGNAASSGDAWDMSANKTQLLWSGNPGVSVVGGGFTTCTPAAFVDDGVSNLIIATHLPNLSTAYCKFQTGITGPRDYYKIGADESDTSNVSGYSAGGTDRLVIFDRLTWTYDI